MYVHLLGVSKLDDGVAAMNNAPLTFRKVRNIRDEAYLSMKLPSTVAINRQLTAQLGKPVIRFEVIPVAAGETLQINKRFGAAVGLVGIGEPPRA